jgi:hypothetical protein
MKFDGFCMRRVKSGPEAKSSLHDAAVDKPLENVFQEIFGGRLPAGIT